jgi:hypothetical protein
VSTIPWLDSYFLGERGDEPEAPFLTARRVLRASEVGSCHQDCIFATSQVRFLSLAARANQLALSR